MFIGFSPPTASCIYSAKQSTRPTTPCLGYNESTAVACGVNSFPLGAVAYRSIDAIIKHTYRVQASPMTIRRMGSKATTGILHRPSTSGVRSNLHGQVRNSCSSVVGHCGCAPPLKSLKFRDPFILVAIYCAKKNRLYLASKIVVYPCRLRDQRDERDVRYPTNQTQSVGRTKKSLQPRRETRAKGHRRRIAWQQPANEQQCARFECHQHSQWQPCDG